MWRKWLPVLAGLILAAGLLATSDAGVINAARGKFFPISSGSQPGDADWISRSTAAGVVVANRLDTTTTINAWKIPDATVGNVSLDTGVHVSGAAGSLKFSVLSTDTTASGSLSVPFGRTFNVGDTIWFSFRRYVDSVAAVMPWSHSSGEAGMKYSILSRDGNGAVPQGSNQVNEIVTQDNYEGNPYQGYNQDGSSSGVPWEITSNNACSSSDFRWQPNIDRGASPLTGNNPNTGSAWTACEQVMARYGGLYSSKSNAWFRPGLGMPITGAVRPTPNSWDTVTVRAQINSMDGATANNRISVWVAPQGGPYTLTSDLSNIVLGNGPLYNGLTLLPYVSNRTAAGVHVSSRTSNITGATILSMGVDTSIGAGVLEYNSITQRFRWQGNGESFGSAWGFSAANNILRINVPSNSPANSYVILEVTPGSLPSSGTVTDTVTVASGRDNTAVYYNDVIVSTQSINAPGGYAPSGVSAIADAAAGMTSGQWLKMTGVGGLSTLSGPSGEGASGIRTPYNNKFAYDPNGARFLMVSGDHDAPTALFIYEDATNTWTRNAVPWTVAPGSAIHGYQGNAVATSNGKLYFRRIAQLSIDRWDNVGTTWTNIDYSSALSYHSNANGVTYFPDIDKVMVFQLENGVNGALIGINPSTNAITTYVSGASSTLSGTGDPHNFLLYNPAQHAIWFGGGNGSVKNWKMDSSGTVTAMPDIPGPVAAIGPGLQQGLPVYNPSNGKFIVFVSATVYYDMDISGSGTWTAHTGQSNTLFASNVYNDSDPTAGVTFGVNCSPREDLGVIACIKAWARSTPGEMWLYKP